MNTATKINATAITISQVPAILEFHANTPGAKPPLFLGLPGLGKTTAIKEFCAANKFDEKMFMLSHYSVPDVKGFGVPNREDKVMEFFPTAELPWVRNGQRIYAEHNGGRRPFVFFDELLQSGTNLFHIAQQLIHEHRVGDNHLPDDVFIAAAANTSAMRCGSNKLTMSLADRFAIYEIRPDMQETIRYFSVQENQINPWIVAFIQANNATAGGVLWSTDASKWSGEEPIDSARSYEKLSKILNTMAQGGDISGHPLLSTICVAHIGQSSGAKLAEFVKLSVAVGDIREMLKKPKTCKLPERPDIRWGVAARVVSYIQDGDDLERAIELARRLTPDGMKPDDDAPTAFEVFVMKSVATVNPAIVTLGAKGAGGKSVWLTWAEKNRKHINPAAA